MTKLSKPIFKPSKAKTKSFLNLGLHSGAANGNLGLVKFALDHGQSIDSVVNGVLPIHAACCSGNPIVVKYLLDRGADVNARRVSRRYSGESLNIGPIVNATGAGSTPLHYACANGCVRTVELLLSYGAFPDIPDKYGSTPLSIALAKQLHDIARLLQNQIMDFSSDPNQSSSSSDSYASPPLSPTHSEFSVKPVVSENPLRRRLRRGSMQDLLDSVSQTFGRNKARRLRSGSDPVKLSPVQEEAEVTCISAQGGIDPLKSVVSITYTQRTV